VLGVPASTVSAAVKTLVLAADLGGTFVFALSGALVGVSRRFDFFGIMLLALAAGSAGGISRDLLIGAVPPAAISDWRYLVASLGAGAITFFWHRAIERLRRPVQTFDAAGLALFAVTGSQKAFDYGLNPIAAVLLGMITGIGGGIVRDVLTSEIPTVLRAEIYAVAGLAGAAVVMIGNELHQPAGVGMLGGAVLCFSLRMVAIGRNWDLPKPDTRDGGS
jgi:uncharacterized membrane protein YeiH